jgi:ribonucleoside-triphosphate reductase
VSYDTSEVSEIVSWISDNWDSYVGVSFLPRNDPTKTAEDLGYPYIPQEVTDKDTYGKYVSGLKPLALGKANTLNEILDNECTTGACPIR